jgi:hypothetical protein
MALFRKLSGPAAVSSEGDAEPRKLRICQTGRGINV